MQSKREGDLSTYHRKIAAKEQEISFKKLKISFKNLKISSAISDWEANVDRVTDCHTSLISYNTCMQQQLHDLNQELHDLNQELHDLYLELHDHYRALHDTIQLKRLRRLEEVSRTITTGKIKYIHNFAFIVSYFHMLPTTVA